MYVAVELVFATWILLNLCHSNTIPVLGHLHCCDKVPQTGCLETKEVCHRSGGWKSEVRVPARSGEGPLLGCRFLVVSSHGALIPFFRVLPS